MQRNRQRVRRRGRLDQDFIDELTTILKSESIVEKYEPLSGELIARTLRLFTGDWKLDSLELVSGTRAVAQFSAASHEVIATINASDFQGFARKRSHGFPNSSPHSDLAVYVSELIQEKILIHSPLELEADEVRIGP